MHYLILMLTLFLISGCAVAGKPSPEPSSPETALFTQGLREMRASGKAPSFERLAAEHPGSTWNEEAQTLLDMAKEMKELNSRMAILQQEKARCQRDGDLLKQENNQLKTDQEKLKNLIIEIERRAQ